MLNIENNQQSLLTFRIGPVLCCAPSLPVTSIITPPKLTHPPGSDSANPGIFKHGPHLVKVVDLRQKFGIDIKDQTQPGNLVISIFEKENYAFWVDQILDVFDFPSEGWGNLPAAIPKGIFTRTLLLNKKIHLYSEFEKLATIPSLGYLEHYINQLKQQNELENKPIIKPVEKISSDSTDAIQKMPVTPSIEKTSKTPTTIKTLDSGKTTRVNKEKSSSAPMSLSSNNNSVDKNNTISVKKTDIKNTNILKAKDTKLVEPVSLIHKKSAPLAKETSSIRTENNAKQNIAQNQAPAPEKTIIDDINEQQKITAHSSVSGTDNNKEQQGTSIFTILFLLLIIGALSYSSYYFLFNEDEIKKTVDPFPPQHEIEISEPPPITIIRNIGSDPVEISAEPEIETSVINSVEDHSIEVEAAETQPMRIETTGIISTINQENESLAVGRYQAEISQLADEITITVIDPLLTETEMVVEAHVNQSNIEESAADKILVKKITAKVMREPVQKPKIKPEIINEIIHIVKKGDTLWAIAKKYVHNPFRYPELARLSNIINPHRIYPGNRVRIRFIKR